MRAVPGGLRSQTSQDAYEVPGNAPGERSLLTEYDLAPGQYQLTASGKVGVRWKYYPVSARNVPPRPPPKHKETDPVRGAQFDRTLSLNIEASTEHELKNAFASLVSDAARTAIIESASKFLESLIARFAAEDGFDVAIEALGRIVTTGSRTHLKKVFSSSTDPRRSRIVLALARVGHREDADFDNTSRRYAALGLGQVGGDQAVQYLAGALPATGSDIRPGPDAVCSLAAA